MPTFQAGALDHSANFPYSVQTYNGLTDRKRQIMFNNAQNSNMQGNIGLGAAIAYFTKFGYPVCIPLTDSQGYDLVVDFNGQLNRIQVKTTKYQRDGKFAISLTIKGGNRSGAGKIKPFSQMSADYVFILTSANDQYLIPSSEVGNYIVLGSKFANFKCAR